MRRQAKLEKAEKKIQRRAEAEVEVGAAMGTGAAVCEAKDIEKGER